MKNKHPQDTAPVQDEIDDANVTETIPVSAENADEVVVEIPVETSEDLDAFVAEMNELRASVAKHEAESKEHYERLQYMAAEFDNYRRRTQKEKEKIYADAATEVVTAFLPVMDNLERAAKACEAVDGCSTPEASALRSGIELVTRQFIDTLEKLGVKEIETVGNQFDPALHNAVMHIEDEAFGENAIVEQYQKGYIQKNGTVIRHSMVKVAN